MRLELIAQDLNPSGGTKTNNFRLDAFTIKRIKLKISPSASSLLLLAFLAACVIIVAVANSNAQQTGYVDSKVIIDDRGVRVKIPSQVNRVVALRPGIVEVMIALGVEDKLVGIDSSTKQGDLYGALNARLRPELKNLPVIMMGDEVNI